MSKLQNLFTIEGVVENKWHIAKNSDRVAQLNKHCFFCERLPPEWNLFMEGMVTYKSIYGSE